MVQASGGGEGFRPLVEVGVGFRPLVEVYGSGLWWM